MSLVAQGLRVHLPIQGAWVLSLVGELRSHMPWSNYPQCCNCWACQLWALNYTPALQWGSPMLQLRPEAAGTGREEGGGFRIGNRCIPMAHSCWCRAKAIHYCKLKNKYTNKLTHIFIKRTWFHCPLEDIPSGITTMEISFSPTGSENAILCYEPTSPWVRWCCASLSDLRLWVEHQRQFGSSYLLYG